MSREDHHARRDMLQGLIGVRARRGAPSSRAPRSWPSPRSPSSTRSIAFVEHVGGLASVQEVTMPADTPPTVWRVTRPAAEVLVVAGSEDQAKAMADGKFYSEASFGRTP